MNNDSLQQYIDLYDSQRHLIDSGSNAVMNRARQVAREVLQGSTLPTKRTPGYAATSIARMFAPDMGVNLQRIDFKADVAAAFRCDIPNMSTLLAVVVNDMFHTSSTLAANLPEGVIFDTINNVAATNPGLLERHYADIAPLDAPAVALNTMMAQDGVIIYVPRGMQLTKTLQLVNIFHSATPLMAFRRVLIVLEEGAEASVLLCDHTRAGSERCTASQIVEISLGRGARLDYCDMEKSGEETSRHAMTFVRQHSGSNAVINATTLTCGHTRNEFTVDLTGENCETKLTGMAIATGSQHIDNYTAVNHLAPHCHSDQLFKYVLEDSSRGAFEGTIHVAPDAPYTTAYQSNRNIVASDNAKMHTEPQLLIYNDEVKCSHGATTGSLDEDALFYMRTRGIPRNEARDMLMQAFMIDVIDSVRVDSLRQRLRMLVEQRFCGGSSNCENCSIHDENV